MKHVFAINSHTTYLTALGTIDFLSIPDNEVIMLYMRNYKNSIIKRNYKIVNINGYDEFSWSRWNRCKYINLIDKMIKNKISEPFEFYAPHLMLTSWQVIYTNKLCKGMSYIQEGGIPFKNAYKRSMTLKEKLKFFYTNKITSPQIRTWRTPYWYTVGTMNKQKEIHSFALNNKFFQYLPSINHIIKWPVVYTGVVIEPDSMIFIYDGFVKAGVVDRKVYLEACRKLSEKYGKKVNYLKFHPGQSEEDKQTIIGFLKQQGLKYYVLPQDVPFELIISSNKNLELAGFSSSLLYFAYDHGHQVNCEDRLLRKENSYQLYEKRYGLIPFKEFIKRQKQDEGKFNSKNG